MGIEYTIVKERDISPVYSLEWWKRRLTDKEVSR